MESDSVTGDTSRIVLAGGNIVSVMTQRLADNMKPQKLQILIYPWIKMVFIISYLFLNLTLFNKKLFKFFKIKSNFRLPSFKYAQEGLFNIELAKYLGLYLGKNYVSAELLSFISGNKHSLLVSDQNLFNKYKK